MKNYIRPIAEVSKFDVADIITVSGEIVNFADITNTADKALYNDYATKAGTAANEAVAVFEW